MFPRPVGELLAGSSKFAVIFTAFQICPTPCPHRFPRRRSRIASETTAWRHEQPCSMLEVLSGQAQMTTGNCRQESTSQQLKPSVE
ncbi:hypothetical protein MPTK1_4g00890 [Marchantia polymorpha subsp. ruderalis]|uniref:Uncharacterized protein n=2 Tax=Marchantia polymorpha TaxID=3197 RepID=A0AAF6B504_MARPO|nr:hypothetical protein MARPO_0066s0054 [Marchantia polymorpha]BBN07088.1 hypothetical protein Mp_4g00890 [Marchantia polymorpha subsp. ruderalis]|eukprot:PTQ36096.1 hypothetical protein MARPO_0066s0054 [Marchantia polymorpha]